MLENGFGEHNIQGIGDKHIPLIHNVMNTDVVVAVSDRATDELDVLFNTDAGRAYLAERKGVPPTVVDALVHFGLSSICNVLAAIKTAKLLGLGPDDAIITVATDGAGAVPERAGQDHGRPLRRRVHRRSTRPRSFGEHLASVEHRPHDRVHRAGPQPHLQPRLLHVGRAAGHAARGVRGPALAGVLARTCDATRPSGTSSSRDFNARTGLG